MNGNRDPSGSEILAKIEALYASGDYAVADQLLGILISNERRPYRRIRLHRVRAEVNLRLGEEARALRCYEDALLIDPEDALSHFRLALYWLARGDYARGFAEYEWRTHLPDLVVNSFGDGKRLWDGRRLDGDGAEDALLIHCEQGIGDTLQFIRFLPQARERVRKIHLVGHTALVRLFAPLREYAEVLEGSDAVPAYGWHIPLLSLPRVLDVTLETVPAAVPYLRLETAARPVPRSPWPRVGLVWRARLPGGRERSADLAALRPLSMLPVDWVSLQKDPTPAEREILKEFRAEELGSGFADFRDTAEVVQGLDLVLAVDTSVAHLAGALARPTWMLLPKFAEWRWLRERDDSPWYPTMTLFRQEEEGDWTGLARRVRARLEPWIAEWKTRRHDELLGEMGRRT